MPSSNAEITIVDLPLIVRKTRQMALILDRKLRVLWVNDVFAAFLGYEAITYPDTQLSDYLDPSSVDSIQHRISDIIEGHEYFQDVLCYRDINGAACWVEAEYFVERDSSGEVIRVISLQVNRPLEEMPLPEKAKAQVPTMHILDHMSDGFVNLDLSWNYSYINEKGAALIGFPKSELIGNNIWEKFPYLINTEFYHTCHKALEENSFCKIEAYYPETDRWFATRFHPHTEGLSIYFQDITSEKKAYQALEESEFKYKQIVESVPGAVIRYQVLSNGEDQLLFMSEKAGELWEVTREEAYQDSNVLWKTVFEEDLPDMQKSVVESAQSLEIWNHQWRIKTDSGKIKWLKAKGFPHSMEDGSTIWDTLIIDITDLRKTSLALKENQDKLVQLTKEHQRILGTISQGLLVFRDNLVFDYCNESAERMLKLKSEDVIGRSLREVFPNAADSVFEKFFLKALREKKSKSFEGYTDRLQQWYYLNVYPNPEENKISVYFHEITKQKKAAEDLFRYKSMLERTEVLTRTGSWELDLKTRKVVWSRELYNIFQIDYDQEVPDFDEENDLIHPEDLKKLNAVIISSISNNTPYRIELRIKRKKDLTIRQCLSLGYPRLNKNGEVTHLFGAFQDITEQKNTELEILKYKSMLERTEVLTHTGSWEWELSTGKAIWSKELFNIFQMDQDQEPPNFRDHGLILSANEVDKIEQAAAHTVANKTPYRLEIDIQRQKDQQIRHCLAIGYPRVNEQGEVTHIFGAFQDITEQKNAEQEILKYKAMLERTEVLTYTGSWEWDVETDKVIWSKELFHLFQIDPSQGAPDFKDQKEIYSPDELAKLQKAVQNAISKKEPYRLELTFIRKNDKEKRHCLTIGYPRLDEQGKVKQLFGAFQDITEQKKAEEKLRIESRRLNDVLKGTNVGTWEWHIPSGGMVYNDRWAEILGYTLEELSPISIKTWERFIHPMDLDKANALLEKHFKGELDYYEFEAQMRHKEGYWIWILDRGKVSEWGKEGQPLLMSGTRQEVTERKNAELELLLKQNELQQLLIKTTDQNKRLQDYAYIVSHNIRSSVANQIGLCAIIKEDPQETYIDMMHSTTLTLDGTIKNLNQLLDFEKTVEQLIKEPCQLNPILQQVVALYQNTIQAKAAELVLQVEPDLEVLAFPAFLESIFHNLIGNALKYGVNQSAKVLEIRAFRSERGVVIRVRDEGPGIDLKKYGKRIFDPGSRFHTRSIEGRGLGLYMTKNQVKALGGEIIVESAPNEGATFEVVLP